ncbi:Multidrug resistance protein MdtA precursor [Novipirellula aureliae]|uniref:Multidrug resistance protein MdtA n=1 Tax=Novipirellula aureliae TaxID=2527966 RepID=A0A5C6DG57_9BACT|nr:efflux RND transporter periplasmic adaptor subunit [Novipirellula aureliae]TWU35708.1 Multidrug resistance protein MdtA precursor [Novipirellula aureliae]
MLRQNQRQKHLSQRFSVSVLSVAMTTFLLGGLVGYLAVKKVNSAGGEVSASSPAGKGPPRSPQAQLVRVGEIQRASIMPVRTLIGDLVALRTATIATEVAGKVVALPVDEGTKVVGGKTVLARIDDTWTKLDEAKIESQIAEKKATQAFEKGELRRFEDMFRQNAVSSSEVEQKRSLIEELEASLSQLQVLLKEAQERNMRLELIAPFDGSVVAKHSELGEYVSVGSQIVEIVSSGRIDARIMVPEESLPLLSVGDSVTLIVDSLGMELEGKVFSINAKGSLGSRTFPVRIALDDQDGKLLPGMGVSVFVPVMRESTELIVPRDAVLIKPDEATLWILQPQDKNGPHGEPQPVWLAQPVPVRVLSQTRESYAIACQRETDVERVVPGVQVVTEGLERLTPGAIVRVDEDRSPLSPVPGTYRTGQQIVDK